VVSNWLAVGQQMVSSWLAVGRYKNLGRNPEEPKQTGTL
jgi:hypothetical protein